MAGYPHDMGHAKEVWRKNISFPECGEIIVLASIEEQDLIPNKVIGQITATVKSNTGGGWSGYMYHVWFDTKAQATNELMRLLFISGPMELEVKDL